MRLFKSIACKPSSLKDKPIVSFLFTGGWSELIENIDLPEIFSPTIQSAPVGWIVSIVPFISPLSFDVYFE